MTCLVLHIREFAACHCYGLCLKTNIAAITGVPCCQNMEYSILGVCIGPGTFDLMIMNTFAFS